MQAFRLQRAGKAETGRREYAQTRSVKDLHDRLDRLRFAESNHAVLHIHPDYIALDEVA